MKKEEGIWVSEGGLGEERAREGEQKEERREWRGESREREGGRKGWAEGGRWRRPRKENHSSWRTESVGAKLTQHGRETDNVARPFSFILPLYNPFSLSTPAVVKSFIAIASSLPSTSHLSLLLSFSSRDVFFPCLSLFFSCLLIFLLVSLLFV